jgi:hypothetical protein
MGSSINQVRVQLASANAEKVIDTIEKLRDSAIIEVVPDLVELLHTSRNPEVKSELVALLNDLKKQESAAFVVESIKNKKYINELDILVASCWQSGLNYNEYIGDFINVLIQSSFQVAFEAFTVIENNLEGLSPENSLKYTDRLKLAINEISADKKALVVELIKMFEKSTH